MKLKKYLKNISWLLLEKILLKSVALFVTIYLIRYLGPEEFGILSYCLSFAGIFIMIAPLGLEKIVVKALVSNTFNKNRILGTSFLLTLLSTLISLIIISLILFFSPDTLTTKALTIIISLSMLFNAFVTIDYYFQSKVLGSKPAKVRMISALLAAGLKILFITFQKPLLWFGAIVLFESMITAIGLIIIFKKEGEGFGSLSVSTTAAKTLLKGSWPLLLDTVAISIYMKIDQIMITKICGPVQNGNYAAAVKISETIHIIPLAIMATIFPAIIASKKSDNTLYNLRIQRLFDFMLWVAIFLILPLFFFSDEITRLIFQERFTESSAILSVHAWSAIFVFIGISREVWLVSEGLQSYALIFSFIGMIINISLNFFLIPIFGALGAAIATLISHSFAAWILAIFFKDTRHSFFMVLNSLNVIRIGKNIINKKYFN